MLIKCLAREFLGVQRIAVDGSLLPLYEASSLLRWRYSPEWALASFTIRLQASRSIALSLHSFIPIFLRSVDTSSSHLIFGLPLRLVEYSFPYNIFFCNCGVLHSFYVTKPSYSLAFNLLTPNVNYSGRTAPLTSKVAFYIFIQQI